VEKSTREKFSKVRLLMVSDVTHGYYWFGDINRISSEARVPVVRVAKIDEHLGYVVKVARKVVTLGTRIAITKNNKLIWV
jgi:bifunctional ADP-heptose synthase (sugar kinase/adenylyltransferase)